MKATTDLFDLVKSMTQSEKRYFKLFITQQKENSSSQILFDAVDKLDEYDEVKLKRLIKNKVIINQLANKKAYLQKQIMKSMHVYYMSQSVLAELRGNIAGIEVLIRKRLLKQASKLLAKSKKTAYKYEFWPQLMEILSWEVILMRYYLKWDKAQAIFIEQQKVMKLYQRQCEYEALCGEIIGHHQMDYKVRSEREKSFYVNFFKHTLLKKTNAPDSFRAKELYLRIYSIYAKTMENVDGTYKYSKLLVEHYNKHPELQETDQAGYLSALENLLFASFEVNKYDVIAMLFKQIQSLADNGKFSTVPGLDARLLQLFTATKMNYHLNLGQEEQAVPILNLLENEFPNIEGRIHIKNRLSLYLLATRTYFQLGDYKKCLQWNNKIMQEPYSDVAAYIHCISRLLNLLIQLELGNVELLEYTIRSTKNYFERKDKLFEIEKLILSFIRKYLKVPPSSEKAKTLFKELEEKLIYYQQDFYEGSPFKHFDFVAWTRAKIEDVPYGDIIRMQFNAPKDPGRIRN